MFQAEAAEADLELEQLQLRQEFYNQLQLAAEDQDQQMILGQEEVMEAHLLLVQSQLQAEAADLGTVTAERLEVLEEVLEQVAAEAQGI
jgi:hypothetical protein